MLTRLSYSSTHFQHFGGGGGWGKGSECAHTNRNIRVGSFELEGPVFVSKYYMQKHIPIRLTELCSYFSALRVCMAGLFICANKNKNSKFSTLASCVIVPTMHEFAAVRSTFFLRLHKFSIRHLVKMQLPLSTM